MLAAGLAACAAAPETPHPALLPTSAAPEVIASVQVHGPEAGEDLDAALDSLRGQKLDAALADTVSAYVRDYYGWLEWSHVQVIVDSALDAQGTLHVIASGDPPADEPAAPLAMAAPAADAPAAPAGPSGARAESALDASFGPWLGSSSRVLIDAAEKRLYLKRGGGDVVSYGVAVGTARTPTPPGDYTIEAIRSQPTWYPPASIRREYQRKGQSLPAAVPPGAHNPLGSWFVRLQNGIGIHGTNQPRSIGHAVSHGCIRMHDRDVAELIRALKRGDGVTIVRSRAAQWALKEDSDEVLRRLRPAGGSQTASR
ncbi:MAG TPA: L,D-transpeptidase [Nevskiaceae bacterium]|nr:L,D-transpeptidase [Nevskiaceae bacterium]